MNADTIGMKRVIADRGYETATRIRIAFASACPDAHIFSIIAKTLRLAPP
jgi:hypothetical protein